VLSLIGSVKFDRWDVATVFVEAAVVEPVDPFGLAATGCLATPKRHFDDLADPGGRAEE
jgi:hypothetical protein